MVCRRICLVSVILVCALYSNASANLFKDEGFGGSLRGWLSKPQQEFANVNNLGVGAGVGVVYFPSDRHLQGLRLDLGWTWYGWDTRDTQQGKIESTRRSFRLTMGPHFSAPLGQILIYVAPMGGVYHYWTTENLEGSEEGQTRFHATKWGWGIGGGILFPIKGGPVHVESGAKEGSSKERAGLEIAIEYHTIRNILGIAAEGGDRDANELAIVIGLFFMPGRR